MLSSTARDRGLYQHVPAAGIQPHREDDGAAASLRQDTSTRTPAELAKYRNLSQQPGQTVRHYGLAGDKIPAGPYGITSSKRDSVAEALQ